MSSMIKYRVHEVAKDFNSTSKVITQILTDYATTPKNHMQVLEDEELDIIFEYITQHNQVNIADIFNVSAPPAEKKPAEKSAKGGDKPAKAEAAKPVEPAPAPKKVKENKPYVPKQVAEKRVVDTRGGSNVNIDKYNEKYDDLGDRKAGRNNYSDISTGQLCHRTCSNSGL